jgi:TonB dependent receptor/Carboxypeptidase regulatory-like domain/TonB-dependent Receptor Plug Domain
LLPRMVALILAVYLPVAAVSATIFGSIRGIVHDPQHRPIAGATVTLRADISDWTRSTTTDTDGQFEFNAVPIGEYTVVSVAPGFNEVKQKVGVRTGGNPVVHLALPVASKGEVMNVVGAPEVISESPTPTTHVDREQIEHTPGAARTNSLAMITDYVPGAYLTHDQLHIRGGHQTSWLIDGVPVPNTNIASNLGPPFDPKDIDYMEVDRGSYGAELGDRTYAVFNIVPRTGFERTNQAEIVTSLGNFYQTNDEFNIGSHSQRFAYYASINANRSNLGIETPVPRVVHDAENGVGGFGSLIFNPDASNQLRLVASMRKDYYQIPYDPNPNDIENAPIRDNGFQAQYPSIGFRDTDRESDALVNFSWVHSFGSELLLTVSPFYHHNRANYDGSHQDFPTVTTDHRASNYAGGQVSFSANMARQNLQAGMYSFYQADDETFAVNFSGASPHAPFADADHPRGSLVAGFLEDQFRPISGLTLTAGLRPTRFSGPQGSEGSVSPRFGAALTVPGLKWTFRAFYGYYYQAPPLVTASGPLVAFAQSNNTAFVPLHGERDEEHQFGLTFPWHGWVLDADTFRTRATNFFDHNNVGESNLFFPLTIDRAVISGWELTLRSPAIAHRAQVHLAYSNQVAQAGGPITGGLTDFSILPFGPLDHDQRNTLNVGGDLALPRRSFAAADVYYGSGFRNAFPSAPYPGTNLPAHTTWDLSLGKDFGERLRASVNALNVANRRVELDNSVTFGGFHWNNPREIYVELRYKGHY